MPELGLQADPSFHYRVYVIECHAPPGKMGPYYYVGIEHRSQIGKRLAQHWGGKGSFYTKEYAPKTLHMVWPAANTAVEGYVFLALLSCRPAGNIEKLGGWSQTSARVSPLCAMVFEQQRRLMRQLCYNCGGSHWASSCPKALEGVTYKCQTCSSNIVITSRGQSQVAGPQAAPRSQAPPPPKMMPAQEVKPQKRAAPRAPSAGPAPKVPKLSVKPGSAGHVVSACSRQYTALSWFLGKPNPSPSICARVREQCGARALELDNGDARTLALQGFSASPPKHPKDLLPNRTRLPSSWVETACSAVRKGTAVKVRKAAAPLTRKGNQILWLHEDLQRALAKR